MSNTTLTPASTSAATRLRARNVSMTFTGTTVLKSANLDVAGGEIVGLLGANGSGKSTMVKVLTGVYRPDRGAEILVGGTPAAGEGYGPLRAHDLGVRVVHQEAPVVPNMTIADMIGLQLSFPTAGPWIRQRRLNAQAEEVMAACDVHLDPRRTAAGLSAAERAMVSLAIVLGDTRPADAVLILDESTASLSTTDAERFLAKVRSLADDGLAVLMVTHRLTEVHDHCDRITVLRDGSVVDERLAAEFDDRAIVHAMAGASAENGATQPVRPGSGTHDDIRLGMGQRPLLRVEGLRGAGVDGVDLQIKAGEILGVAGRADGGAAQLLRLVAGMDLRRGGRLVSADGTVIGDGPRGALAAGIVYLSSDRLSEGGVLSMSVAENLVLPRIERFGVLGRGKGEAVARMMKLLDIRPADPGANFGTLSGGNQQKVLLGRWLLLEPRLLVLDDPTAGVDPATRERLFGLVADLSADGVAVLIRSTEPDQLARLCHRVVVMRDGSIVGSLTGELVNPEEISLATFA